MEQYYKAPLSSFQFFPDTYNCASQLSVFMCHYYFWFFISLLSLSLLFVIGKRYTCHHVQKLIYSAARPQTLNSSLYNSQTSLFPVLTGRLIPRLAFKPQVLLQWTYGRGMCSCTVTSTPFEEKQNTVSGMPKQDRGTENKPLYIDSMVWFRNKCKSGC